MTVKVKMKVFMGGEETCLTAQGTCRASQHKKKAGAAKAPALVKVYGFLANNVPGRLRSEHYCTGV